MIKDDIRTLSILIGTLAILGYSTNLFAALNTLEFKGALYADYTAFAIQSPLESTFSYGDPFSMLVTYDTATLNSSSDPARGQYNNAITELYFTLGSYSGYAIGGDHIGISNNVVADPISNNLDVIVFSSGYGTDLQGAPVEGLPLLSMTVTLGDLSGTAFDDISLPDALNIDSFSDGWNRFQIAFGYNGIITPTNPRSFLNGTITSVSVVPEPISFILFLVGGTFLAGRSYIKRKKA